MPDMKDMLAKKLAALFPGQEPGGACACTGNCMYLGCVQNWRMLLENPKRLGAIMHVGIHAEQVMENDK